MGTIVTVLRRGPWKGGAFCPQRVGVDEEGLSSVTRRGLLLFFAVSIDFQS